MTLVVLDASAGVEMAADTPRGRLLRPLLPSDAVLWVPDVFYAECGAVLRRWDLNRVLPAGAIAQALAELEAWPLRLAGDRELITAAWNLRHNVTFQDGLYVALAERLGAELLTDDRPLVRAPNLPVATLHL